MCVSFLLAARALSAAEPFVEKTNLFTEATDGFRLYRIPGIVVTARGSVLAYCEARKFTVADRGEIEIHLRRSTDDGRTWSPAKQVAHLGPRLPRNPHLPEDKKKKDMGGPDEQTVNNPVAIAARDGAVHLLYCVEYMRAFHIRSDDDGVTWSCAGRDYVRLRSVPPATGLAGHCHRPRSCDPASKRPARRTVLDDHVRKGS